MRTALAAAAVVPVALVATAVPATAATPTTVHAASAAKITAIPTKGYSCSGRLLQKKNLVINGKVAGVLKVFTTKSGHVNVKACYYPSGAYAKTNHLTVVAVDGYASRTAKKPVVTSMRRANTHKSMGPAGVKGLDVIGRCAQASAAVKDAKGKVHQVSSGGFCYTYVRR